ncbi:MAG: hypothetical protein J5819_06090 [Eubacterium sp.]|nr:hypothetical protein [Eubacterium sp.]
MKKIKIVFSVIMSFAIVFSVCFSASTVSFAKANNTKDVYSAVQSAYSSGFPLNDNNMIHTERTNIFGQYSTVLGVSSKLFSEYTAAQKSNSEMEYICFICKGTSRKAVKKIKNSMKKYVVNEYNSNISYHSDYGKTLLRKAKVGSKGKFVYLFVLDISGNEKAIEAFKEVLS